MERAKAFEIRKLKESKSKALSIAEQAFALGATSPLELDHIIRHLGYEPRLVNPFLASQIRFSEKSYLYLPIQISEETGGRRSLYFLEPGEEVATGYLIPMQSVEQIDGQILVRWVERLSGQGKAKTGDKFVERFKNLDNFVLTECVGELEVVDEKRGVGRFRVLTAPFTTITPSGKIWIGWSLIYIEW